MVHVAATSFVVALLLCANAIVNVPLNSAAAWMQQCIYGPKFASATWH